jgi:predicted deacylase
MGAPDSFHGHDRSWMDRRVIGRANSGRPGPLLICLGGVHGNEPSGGQAILRILHEIEHEIPLRRGRLVAITGNRRALLEGRRYIDEDLNRVWTEERYIHLRQGGQAPRRHEEREMLGMLEIIEEELALPHDDVHLIDLHSTSGPGVPFGCAMDAGLDPAFFSAFTLPILVGLGPQMKGTVMDWFTRRGHSAIGVEGGQHGEPETVDAHEAVLRVALDALGLRGIDADPGLDEARALLEKRAANLPRVLEVMTRFEVEEDSDFAMLPGFRNFDRVEKGQALARDRRGAIRAESSGWLLFPRYQAQGNDGFFLAREL